jgi:hypothetical protein
MRKTTAALTIVGLGLALLLASCGLPTQVSQTTPPTVAITSPAGGQQVPEGQELMILFTATDAQGVARVEVGVDGVLLQTVLNPSPAANALFSGQQPWTATKPGPHSLMAIAYNSAGMASSPAVVNIAVIAGGGEAPPPQTGGSSGGGSSGSGAAPTATWTPIGLAPDTPLPPPTDTSAPPPPADTSAPPTPTDTSPPPATPEPTATATVKPTANSGAARPSAPGPITDFEDFGTWKRGDQANGTFTQSTEQAHSGSHSGKLAYNFPTGANDFVVFSQAFLLGGQPNQISAWVYGDGSKHYLNVWIKDAKGETWQFTLGQVKHTGWQQMTAWLDPGAPWPAGHIDGPSNGTIDYPIDFRALALDDVPDSYAGSGAIYVDDLRCDQGAAPQPTATTEPTSGPPPAAASIRFWADETSIASGNCTRLRWEVDNVREVYLDGEGQTGYGKQKVCPTTTTTYVLRVVHLDGTVTEHPLTIQVTGP